MAFQQDVIQNRCDELIRRLAEDTLDFKNRKDAQKELSKLTSILDQYKAIEEFKVQIESVKNQLSLLTDVEMQNLYKEELFDLESQLEFKNNEFESLIYPCDPYDSKSAFVEVRAGTGGQEAALFAGDLMQMYTAYAYSKNWVPSVVSYSETDIGGIKEIVLEIQGKNVYGHLKHESGVHRVQRVPKTENSGRIHTSTATVAVLPELDDVEFIINPADLRIDVYRASGAGGQHVNTTDSAVRITHIPTNVVVTCQDERSQHKNKAKALKMLQSRLVAAHNEKQAALESDARKKMVGQGMRSEKVRTYNYPQNRITDHQVELTLNKLDIVMAGKLDEIVDALMKKERSDRFQKPLIV